MVSAGVGRTAGANLGGFSVWMADKLDGQKSTVKHFAYEPVADHFAVAKQNIDFHGFNWKIKFRKLALAKHIRHDVIKHPSQYSQKYRFFNLGFCHQGVQLKRIGLLM